MNSFEYARPETEAEAVEMLSAHDGQTAVEYHMALHLKPGARDR